MLTVDASVWVGDQNPGERNHADSRRFVNALRDRGEEVVCPTLCPTEVAAAIARPTGNTTIARRAANGIRNFPYLRLKSLTLRRDREASRIAIQCRLRGADAVYVALAAEYGATLITWDAEIITRAASVITVMTPTDWLAQNPPPQTPGSLQSRV